MKPKAILLNLAERGYAVPSQRQLNNYLSLLRKEKYGPSKISIGELTTLNNHRQAPENPHQSFVLDYNTNAADTDDVFFQFVFTTKYLLGNLNVATNIHADSTYKLIWQGFPVLVIGTTDQERHFHIIALGVCTFDRRCF